MEIIKRKYNIFLFYLVFSCLFLFKYLFHSSLPFKYDWTWPLLNSSEFWNKLTAGSSLSFLGIFSQNASLIFGVVGFLGISSELYFKIFIIVVHACAGYGFYKFIFNRTKSYSIALISGMVYAFTPYIFIRTIVGFIWSLLAYAILPFFLDYYFNSSFRNKIMHFLILGILISLIFAQIQAGLLITLLLSVNLMVAPFYNNFRIRLKGIANVYIGFILVNIPWLILVLVQKSSLKAISGGSATTLNFIASLPHSFRNIFMLSDHHITANFFYPLAHEKLYLLGWLIVWFVAFCAVFNKKNRELVLTFLISSLIILPFTKGPAGIFGGFYTCFFNHFPQIAVFREVYHFEFLYAVSLCVLFAFGLDFLWHQISKIQDTITKQISNSKLQKTNKSQFSNNKKLKKLTSLILISLKAVFAGSAIFIIAPYLTFDYAGYLKPQKIPSQYNELNNFLKENKDYCKKIYYPPGLGFVYFKNDQTAGASNSDTLAEAIGVKYLDEGASVLVLPSEEMFYRNELVSQFYEKADNGEFASLMKEDNIDCVILRLDTETKYGEASNLWREKDPAVVKKWNNTDLKELVESKKGIKLKRRFGENIYIYKSETRNSKLETNSNFQNSKLEKTGNSAKEQFAHADNLQLTTYNLPLTDWANNYAYYKDGWSRGRYDFWRKLLFTQLRQDFIYTDKSNSLLNGTIDQKGDYELWVRYLTGGKQGSIQITVDSKQFTVTKDTGEEKFVWKNIGDIKLNGKTDIEIKNISGENAIADLVLVKQ